MKKISLPYLSFAMALSAVLLSGIGMAMTQVNALFNLPSGILISIQYTAFTVFVILGGILADRYGKIRIMKISLLLMALGAFAFGFCYNVAFAFIAVSFIGAFGAIMENDVTALAMDCDESEKDKRNVIVQVFFSVGAAVCPLVFYAFETYLHNWRYTYILFGVFVLVCFILAFNKKDKTVNKDVKIKDVFDIREFKNAKYLIAPVTMLLYVAAEIGIWGFVPVYLTSLGVQNAFLIGALSSSGVWISMALGRFLTDRLIKKFKITQIMIWFVFVTVLGICLILLLSGYAVILAACLCGFGFAPFYPLIISWMKDITGKNSSSMIAITMAAGSLGPVFAGFINSWLSGYSIKAMMYLPLACFLCIFIILIIFKNTKKPD